MPHAATSPTDAIDASSLSEAIASTGGAYFFRRALFLFAVLRAVFFAADLLFAFALFAMLPS